MPPADRLAVAQVPRTSFDWAGVAAFLALGIFFCAFSVQKLSCDDLWWQLRTGQWILEHGTVPTQDAFSFSVVGHEWIEMRWLFCVLAYLGWQSGGPSLLILAQTALVAAGYAIIVWPVRRVAVSLPGFLVLMLGVGAAASRFILRPEIVTNLCLCIFLVMLHGYTRGRFRRTVWLLPLLQVVWTNMHTVFVFGPVLAWMFALGDVARRVAARPRHGRVASAAASGLVNPQLLLLAVLVTAACWVNPYGNRGALFPLLLFREIHRGNILSRTITELWSPFAFDRWSWDTHVGLALAAVSAGSFGLNWKRTDPTRLTVWSAFLYLAAVSVRNVAPWALVATWAALHNLEETFDASQKAPASGRGMRAAPRQTGRSGTEPHRVKRRGRALTASGGGDPEREATAGAITALWASRPAVRWVLAALLLTASWYVVTDRYYVRMGIPRRFGLGVLEWQTPAEATKFVLDTGALPQVFHSMTDGSYLVWAAAERFPVFVDGRLELYGEEFFKRFLRMTATGRGWDGFADQHGINTAILQTEYFQYFIAAVAASPHWVLVHVDPHAVVFVRDIPEHAELIRRYRIDPRQPWVPRAPELEEMPTGWRRLIGSVEEPRYALGMATNFVVLGSLTNAEGFLTHGLERFPDHAGMRQLLAQIQKAGRAGRR